MPRSDQELIRRADPVKGDWVNILKENLIYIGEEVNEEEAK